MGDHIGRIGNAHQYSIKTGLPDFFCNIPDNRRRSRERIHSCLSLCLIRIGSHRNYHHIPVPGILVISRFYFYRIRQISRRIPDIQRLCRCFFPVDINQDYFSGQPLGGEGISRVGAHMTRSYNDYFSCLFHRFFLLS